MQANIKIQLFEIDITAASKPEIKEAFDKDYKYLVGIAIADGVCSDKSTIKSAKIKGVDFLPNDFEVVNIISSKAVEPNKRFFCLFDPVEINGDDLRLVFLDPDIPAPYTLKVQALLTNDPNEIRDVILGKDI